MKRRELIASALIATLAAVAPSIRAQAPSRVRRLAVLPGATPEDMRIVLDTLRDLGWVEGRNLVVLRRAGWDRPEQLADDAQEFARQNVDVIMTIGMPATQAAQRATARIPIVMDVGVDPVAAGFVASLSRPGGNITGHTSDVFGQEAKRIALLKEVLPTIERAAVFVISANPAYDITRDARQRHYDSVRVAPILEPVASTAEIDPAIADAHRRGAQAIMISADGFWYRNRAALVNAATRKGLPIICADPDILRAGALLSLVANEEEGDRSIARVVDKILHGAKPADIPVQQSSRYILSVNVATARALNITIPQALLLRADEVIR